MANRTVYVDGTTSGTPGSNGAHYATLQAAILGEDGAYGDLVTDTCILSIEISLAGEDTTPVNITGFTTSAEYYINIYTTAAARHAGKWDDTKYHLSAANGNVIYIDENYVRLNGLQIELTSQTGSYIACINTNDLSAGANRLDISNCLLLTAGSDTYTTQGIRVGGNSIANVWNCIIDCRNANTEDSSHCIDARGATLNLYSSTLVRGAYGLGVNSGTVTCKNCYIGGSDHGDIVVGSGTIAKTNVATSDTSGTRTGASETASNCVNSVALGTDTFVDPANATVKSRDYHLAADGLSPLQAVGVDTTGDSAPLNFTTDIDGQTRDATWDIGADAAASGPVLPDLTVVMEEPQGELTSFGNLGEA